MTIQNNIKIARIFTVLHLLVALIAIGLYIISGAAHHVITAGTVISAAFMLGLYYAFIAYIVLDVPDVGDVITQHPVLSGTTVIWTDLCVSLAIYFEFFRRDYSPSDYYQLFYTVVGISWIAPIAILLLGYLAVQWVRS
jgi:hypothetical protein